MKLMLCINSQSTRVHWYHKNFEGSCLMVNFWAGVCMGQPRKKTLSIVCHGHRSSNLTMGQKQNGQSLAGEILNSMVGVKIVWLWFQFHRNVIPVPTNDDLAPNERQAIVWSNGGWVYIRINASPGLDKFISWWNMEEVTNHHLSFSWQEPLFERNQQLTFTGLYPRKAGFYVFYYCAVL